MADADVGARPRLAPPSAVFRISFLAALDEYHAEGRHLELERERLDDPREFARYVSALRAGVVDPGEPDRYVARLAAAPAPDPPEGGYAPQTILWWVAGDAYFGRASIRHHLTPDLLREGGNIGFEVRPSARGRGHATGMLAQALRLAAALGIDPAHVDCDAGNAASRRVIEKSGGRLVDERDGSQFFLVPTPVTERGR